MGKSFVIVYQVAIQKQTPEQQSIFLMMEFECHDEMSFEHSPDCQFERKVSSLRLYKHKPKLFSFRHHTDWRWTKMQYHHKFMIFLPDRSLWKTHEAFLYVQFTVVNQGTLFLKSIHIKYEQHVQVYNENMINLALSLQNACTLLKY